MCVRFGIESFFSCNYKQSFIKRNAFFVIFFMSRYYTDSYCLQFVQLFVYTDTTIGSKSRFSYHFHIHQ